MGRVTLCARRRRDQYLGDASASRRPRALPRRQRIRRRDSAPPTTVKLAPRKVAYVFSDSAQSEADMDTDLSIAAESPSTNMYLSIAAAAKGDQGSSRGST